MEQPTESTRHTLIRRVRNPDDEIAWGEFVERYRDFIFHLLHRMDVAPDDVEDLAQQILLKLTTDLGGYDRSRGRFRVWLSAVIRHGAIAHHKKQRYREGRLRLLGKTQDVGWLFSDKVTDLDHAIEHEWAAYVANLAMAKVKTCFEGRAVRAFELYLDGCSACEISGQTGLAVSSVYTLRKRVKKRLYQEIRELTAELESPLSHG